MTSRPFASIKDITGIDLFLREHQIAHHDVVAARRFRECHPSPETERGRRLPTGDGHGEIRARNVHFQDGFTKVPLLAQESQDFFVFARNRLRRRRRMKRPRTAKRPRRRSSFSSLPERLSRTSTPKARETRAAAMAPPGAPTAFHSVESSGSNLAPPSAAGRRRRQAGGVRIAGLSLHPRGLRMAQRRNRGRGRRSDRFRGGQRGRPLRRGDRPGVPELS